MNSACLPGEVRRIYLVDDFYQNDTLRITLKNYLFSRLFMNFTVPLIALCMAISKFSITKYRDSSFTPRILIVAAAAATVIFNIGFGHLVSTKVLIFLYTLPVINLALSYILASFGLSRYGIPVFILINLMGACVFMPYGFLIYLQGAWSLSLISSMIITNQNDFYKPLIETRRKKHEYSI